MFIYKSINHLNNLNVHGKLLRITHPCKFLGPRKISDVPRKFVTFDEVIAQRRAEARRSLVVQVNSESSFEELYGYCSKYTEINGVHHYRNTEDEHFMLIEFRSEQNLEEVLQNCSSHQADSQIMALQSPFLWFRAVAGKKQKLTVPSSKLLTIKDGNAVADDNALFEELRRSSSISEQIQLLYDRTTLNDLGVRLRFMVARQLECVFSSLYANIAVRPFGSSVNGFGKMGCDVDLSLTNLLTVELCDPSKRLVYQEQRSPAWRRGGEAGRGAWQRHVQLLGELVELRVAGARRVQRIVHARVPIVKYAHQLAAVDCDLCYNNMSGLYMSELLWQCGALEPRARPLAVAVRRWAAAAALTSAHPGGWITNFSLTLLVLFFLQQPRVAALPPLRLLVDSARDEDKRIAEDNLSCTFLRDLNLLPPETYGQSDANLETLLTQFFEFYAQFDFEDQAISIIEGTPVRKPTYEPLCIVNPLEQSMNVSRNVNLKECDRLRMEMKNAAWQLEACMEKEKTDSWGLLSILEDYHARNLKKLIRVGNSHRLVSIKDLFKDDEEDERRGAGDEPDQTKTRLTQKSIEEVENSVKEMKEMLQQNGEKNKNEQKVTFKNSHVAGLVNRIMRNKLT